jgi:hypothetical protein
VTVGCSARDGLRSDVAARTGLVLDDDGLVPLLPQLLAEDARQRVGTGAGRERDGEKDRPVGQPLGLGLACHASEERGRERAARAQQPPAAALHVDPPGPAGFSPGSTTSRAIRDRS